MGEERKGMMRGYKKLRVWQDAKDLYVLTWKVFKKFPIELSRIRSQQLASVDSVHRNISEGYCRRSLKEYIQHLNIALGSFQTSDAENEHAHEHYPKRMNFLHHIMISFSRNCYEY